MKNAAYRSATQLKDVAQAETVVQRVEHEKGHRRHVRQHIVREGTSPLVIGRWHRSQTGSIDVARAVPHLQPTQQRRPPAVRTMDVRQVLKEPRIRRSVHGAGTTEACADAVSVEVDGKPAGGRP